MSTPPSPNVPSRRLGLLKACVCRVGAQLAAGWRVIRVVLLLMKPARFSLIMVVVGLGFLFLSDQGFDTLRDFAERKAGTRHNATQTLAFWMAGFLWAYGSWFWARVLSKIRLGDALPDTPVVRAARVWIPRLIGAAAIFGLAVAFYQAAAPYSSAPDSPGMILKRYAAYSLAGGVVFLLFVVFRRTLSPKLATIIERAPGGGSFGRVLRGVKSTEEAKKEFGSRDVREVLHEARWLLGSSLMLAAVLFVLFAISPEWFGPRFGSAPILLLAAAGWIAFGSAADLFAMVYRFPVWVSLVGAALVFSFVNDNHAVRTLNAAALQPWKDRQNVEDALDSWRQFQQRRPATGAEGGYPLFVVAAEGGGIRAAYWTASVLGEIQDRHPCFADQLFALSGVSGGSLGIAVFAALLGEDRYRTTGGNCSSGGGGKTGTAVPAAAVAKDRNRPPERNCVRCVGEAVLGEDFLAPALAAMLYPDLFQLVVPFPVPHFDRARALETSWEQAWQFQAEKANLSHTTRLADPFGQLWRGPADRWMPALLLNSTMVETGRRLITSNLKLTPMEFADVEDTHRFYGEERELPLSTAVHLSARFTYVSPAGTLAREGKVYGRAVDGGYFENSGTTAALEILDVIDAKRDNCKARGTSECRFWRKVNPVMILITNEPSDNRYREARLTTDPDLWEPALRPTPCCNEVWSPLRAMLATRGARGQYARETAGSRYGRGSFLEFGLCRDDRADIPLGWTLSRFIRRTMQNQLKENSKDTCPAYDNPARLNDIARLLRK